MRSSFIAFVYGSLLLVLLGVPGAGFAPALLSPLCAMPAGAPPEHGGNVADPEALRMWLERVRADLNVIVEQEAGRIEAGHELHDYFAESAQIITRLLQYIEADLENGDLGNAALGVDDAAFLTGFLREEMDVARSNGTASSRVYDVHALGLKGDGVTDNRVPLREFLRRLPPDHPALELVFPEGEYRFEEAAGEYAILLKEQRNLTFTGLGKVVWRFSGHREGSALMISRSENLCFRNLVIEISPLPCTLSRIASVEDGNTIRVEIEPGYPEPDASYQEARILRGLVRDPVTLAIKERSGDPRIVGLTRMDNGAYELELDDNALSGNKDLTGSFRAGSLFSIHPRGRPGSQNLLNIISSRHLFFKDVRIHAAAAMGSSINRSAGIKFLDCAFEPGEGVGIMNNADGINCPSNYKGVYLERCRVLKTNDDCLNFHAGLKSVIAILGDREFIVTGPELDGYFGLNDPVVFINTNTGEFDAHATVSEIKKVSYKDLVDCWLVRTRESVPGIISRVAAGRDPVIRSREYTSSGGDAYRRAMAIQGPFEHMIMNLRLKNDGFIIRNCEFGLNRATGFRCKGTNGLIKNSRFHRQYIDFKVGFDWHEGTYPSNIELVDVTLDKGAFFYASLPGKVVDGKDLRKYFRNINFINVRDAAGNSVSSPLGE